MKRFILCIVILISGCSSADMIDRENRTSENTILNYEDTARQYTSHIEKNHFVIHITSEMPHVVSFKNIKPGRIYRVSRISGTAIFHAVISPSGKIVSFEPVKRAGLRLDRLAKKILKSIKIKPAERLGRGHSSKVSIRILFKGKRRI